VGQWGAVGEEGWRAVTWGKKKESERRGGAGRGPRPAASLLSLSKHPARA